MSSIIGSLLEIAPGTEVAFDYYPNKYLSAQISLKNITNSVVAFKIKTNAPQSYIVKPHTGLVTPYQTAFVVVTMQPVQLDPQSAQIKDKFLITACAVPSDTTLINLGEKWDENKVISHKLKVDLKFEGIQNKRSELTRSTMSDYKDAMDISQPLKEEQNSGRNNLNNLVTNNVNLVTTGKENISIKSQEGYTTSGNNQYERNSLNKVRDLDAKLAAVEEENRTLNREIQELLKKTQEQANLIHDQETKLASLKSEIDPLRNKAFAKHMTKEQSPQINNYQLWHVIMVAIFGLILGAFLSSN